METHFDIYGEFLFTQLYIRINNKKKKKDQVSDIRAGNKENFTALYNFQA